MSVWSLHGDALRLAVRVQPRSSRNRVVGTHGEAVKVQVTAPPVEGAANEAVVAVVAEWLGVARRAVAIVQGLSGRDKVVEVTAADPLGLGARVDAALRGLVDKPGGRR